MELGRHALRGDLTGNPAQPIGRHLENIHPSGVGLFPLGDRDRVKPEYGENLVEERDSLDVTSKWRHLIT